MIPRASFRYSPIVRIIVSVLLVAACSEQPLPTGLIPPSVRLDIADASGSYKSGFYWLPPVVKQPSHGGTFDAALSPLVEICELTDGVCASPIAEYTTSEGTGGELVRLDVDEEHYHVNWHTNEFDLSTTKLYRVSVRAGIHETLLGYADVQPVTNGSGLKKVDTDEYIGLVDGRTLPIKFRIETGIVGNVRVEPIEAEAEPGTTQQFVAILSDLHGNSMSAAVTWASSDEAVATVTQTGLATAIDDGFATITATSEGISGTAMLIVEGGAVVLDAGRGHSCAVALDGRAFCWGRNDQGQLGDGTLSDRRTPTAVLGGITFASITAGDFHTCGITTEGQAYCWGLNQFGRLGDGSQTRRLTPVAVSGGIAFASISAGDRNTCGITADNRAYCWGEGGFGANGNGSPTNALTPQLVSGGHSFTSISVSSQYVCGVTTGGQGYCWGNGNSGRLGNGSSANRSTPFPIAGGLTLASLSTGNVHACAVTTSGEGYCWGAGQFGRLGNGSITNFPTPHPVSGGIAFSRISAGGLHTCGVAVNGTGYCWGGNVDGNLGTGSSQNTIPRPVVGGLTWASINASGQIGPSFDGTSIFAFSCGVTVDNRTYCWGSGFFGSLGNGSTGNRGSPTPVAAFP
jgi:alpha-tubulin suppressor-like RCC1 family protein